MGALLAFRATTTVHRGEAVLPEFGIEEKEVVSGVDVYGAEVVSIVEEEGNAAVSHVEEDGSEAVSVEEVVDRYGVGVVVEVDTAESRRSVEQRS